MSAGLLLMTLTGPEAIRAAVGPRASVLMLVVVLILVAWPDVAAQELAAKLT